MFERQGRLAIGRIGNSKKGFSGSTGFAEINQGMTSLNFTFRADMNSSEDAIRSSAIKDLKEYPARVAFEYDTPWGLNLCCSTLRGDTWDDNDRLHRCRRKTLFQTEEFRFSNEEKDALNDPPIAHNLFCTHQDRYTSEVIRHVILARAWQNYFGELLSAQWLAAHALYEYYVRGDNFAFGVMSSELRRKIECEQSYLRGEKVRQGQKLGGEMRRGQTKPNSQKTLEEMRRLISGPRRMSISSAANIAAKNGLGASQDANRKLWYRNAKKLGHV